MRAKIFSVRWVIVPMYAVVAFIITACAGSSVRESDSKEPPNIILILADDMGYSDIGCYGSEIRTPNIDALAKDGLLFTQFYNTGRCCPSRASLLTGMYSHKAGIGHMVADLNHRAYKGYLNDQCLTIAEALKPAGYTSYMSGKWHVGTQKQHWPLQRGFEKFYGSNTSQGHYFRVYEGRKLIYDNQEVSTQPGWYATDAFTDSTIAFIRRHQSTRKQQPFFMYVAYTAPHWPIHALEEDIQKYAGRYDDGYQALRQQRLEKMKRLSLISDSWKFSPLDAQIPEWQTVDANIETRKMEVYAAMIDRMDQGIGRILETLKAEDIENNTVVLFLSDNGGCAEEIHRSEPGAVIGQPESYTSIGLPWANVNNTPFRKYKSWVHEGGISTPLIIRYPALIKEGRTTNEPGHIIDLMPTFLDLAGIRYPGSHNSKSLLPLDGESLFPILQSGSRKDHDLLFWEHEGNRAVRQAQWKLVSAYRGSWELYDMEKDRTEMIDLADEYPDKVKELSGLYEEWAMSNQVLPWDEVRKLRAAN